MTGYSRQKFTHWTGQGSGCDTRDVVLKRDGKDVQATADCKITAGSWHSAYDDKDFTDPKALDIDHMVPLAAAWRTGAAQWTDQQRKEFANDLTRPQLFAVSAGSNRAKGDQDPSTWKPPNHDYWCTYAQSWVTVKAYYKLSVTQAEKTALTDMLATCK
ncbi:HNH endonuclease family protein [Dactylosporangium sp. NPDC051484]|uniref:HNH endonuclease family protein n=1 Tax=Dactylosporangium sp. NPDC051484 TaxID=3154942 RepID=UPI00344E2D4D